MSKQIEFSEIDFEAIEYRNEYRHTNAVFAFVATQALSLAPVLAWLFEGDGLWLLLGTAYLGLFMIGIASLFIQYRSRDENRKITVEQSLENFDRFCDDLTERWRLAIDRYQGYTKGTSAREPERCLKTQETLKSLREETLLKARSSSENQKAISIRQA